MCESRGGRPGLPFLLNKPTVSVDVKQHSTNQNGNNRIELSGTEARTQAAMLLLLLFKGPQSTCWLFWRLYLGVFAVVTVVQVRQKREEKKKKKKKEKKKERKKEREWGMWGRGEVGGWVGGVL